MNADAMESTDERWSRMPTLDECKSHNADGIRDEMACLERFRQDKTRNFAGGWRVSDRYFEMLRLREKYSVLANMPECVIPDAYGADILLMTERGMFQIHARFESIIKNVHALRLNLTFVAPDHVVQMCIGWDRKAENSLNVYMRKRIFVQPAAIAMKEYKNGRPMSIEIAAKEHFERFSEPMKQVLRDPWLLYSLCLLVACKQARYMIMLCRFVKSALDDEGTKWVAPCFYNRPWGVWEEIAKPDK